MQRLIAKRSTLVILACSAISLTGYLLFSHYYHGSGFPLDDAWIHQTYARNLAAYGEWSFLPGVQSAGSTAPLWSFWISFGYLLNINPLVWTFLTGWLLLAGVGFLGLYAISSIRETPDRGLALTAGGLLAFEWHLVWAAASGMETLLSALVFGCVVIGLLSRRPQWGMLGALVGISIWVRPDGLTLWGPLVMVILLNLPTWKERMRALAGSLVFFGVTFFPYLLFNRALAGSIWPNTFFAKQAEYAVMQNLSILDRVAGLFSQQLIGVGAILIPGFVWFSWKALRSKEWATLAGIFWWAGFHILYAWRLPVTYQHGRYLIPVMPLFFIWGTIGTFDLVEQTGKARMLWTIGRAWIISCLIVAVSFWVLGAQAYSRDVAVIQSEMVTTAKWIAEETGPDELVAAHDIGALGYFSGRKIVDLAGLVSPEVIPIIRDEQALASYLNQVHAVYLVTFPDWYPELVQCGEKIYDSNGEYSPRQGGENMTVYRWKQNCTFARIQ